MLKNGSFEGGWKHPDNIRELQVPDFWSFTWLDADDINPIDGALHNRFVRPEMRVLPKDMLPVAEQALFIRDGVQTLKVFKGYGAWSGKLSQAVELTAGEYWVTIPIYADVVMDYKNGQKVFANDPRACRVRLWNGGKAITDWIQCTAGQWTEISVKLALVAGLLEFELMLPFALKQNGVFMDGLKLEPATVPPPPPEPPKPPPANRHKAIIVKMPQVVTVEEALSVARYCHPYRHTITQSHDDTLVFMAASGPESYVKIVYPNRQQDVLDLLTAAGYRYEIPKEFDDRPSSAPLKLAHPFQWRYIRTSKFNDPRSYANGKHEGIDFDVVGGLANNRVDVLCVLPGTVEAVYQGGWPPDTGYGAYVRVRSIHNGKTVLIWYAHLDAMYVRVGQQVKVGQPVGELGNTGNSTSEHVHITLQIVGEGLPGYVVPHVVDPEPYFPSAAERAALPSLVAPLDLLPFLRGPDKTQFDMGYDGGTQSCQIRRLNDTDWLYVKGENGEYERLGLRQWGGREWIFRFEDTSESPTRFYAHYRTQSGEIGAPWIPRYVNLGEWYETTKFVQHYLKANCTRQNSGTVTDRVRLMTGPHRVTYPQSARTIDDVITLEWTGGEQYDFAGGNIAFRDKTRVFWFIDWLWDRPDKAYKKPVCIDVGW